MPRVPRPAFCLVTPGTLRSAEDMAARQLVRLVGAASRAGIHLVQVREHGLADLGLARLVARIAAEVEGPQTLVVVNERADVALTAGAAGVHLRATGVAAARVRPIVPEEFVIGRSVHSIEEALAAEAAGGVDYLIFGTVFASPSKPAHHPVAGVERLREVCSSVRLPVIAIGGITPERLTEIAAAGASGFAAIGMFVAAAESAQERLADLVERATGAFADHSRA